MARLGTVSIHGLTFGLDPSIPPNMIVVESDGARIEMVRVGPSPAVGSSSVCPACKGVARMGKHRNDAACKKCGGRGWIVN